METEKLQSLEARIQRIQDILEIQQLQNKYEQWIALFRGDKIIELFARKVPDVSMESGAPGVYEGYEAIKEFFHLYGERHAKAIGMLVEHYAICPVIEVAKDGKTAKGTWFSPGILGLAPVKKQAWDWGKYGCDYIKEDGKWKFWHLKWYPTFNAEYEKGWLYKEEISNEPPKELAEKMKVGNKPGTYRKPYDPLTSNYLLPEPPESYDSY